MGRELGMGGEQFHSASTPLPAAPWFAAESLGDEVPRLNPSLVISGRTGIKLQGESPGKPRQIASICILFHYSE